MINRLFASKQIVCCVLWFLYSAANAEKITDGKYTYYKDSQPAWVYEYPLQQEKLNSNKQSSNNIKNILIDRQVSTLNQQQVSFFHYARQPLAEDSLQNVSEISLNYSPDYQQLILHNIQIHRQDKIINKLHDADIKLIQREREIESSIYNGIVSALIVLRDVRLNDIVEYSYSIVGSNPVFGDKYFDFFSMSWSAPVDQTVVRIITEKNSKLNYKNHGFSMVPEINNGKQSIEYIWNRNNIAAYYDEGEYPNWFIPGAWLEVSEYKMWHEVVDWAIPLYKKQQELSESLTKTIKQWQKNSKSEAEFVEKALRFVQSEIRYYGVEYGQNSHKPTEPNEVFERRYGDCKDKTLLLSSLLNAAGIKSSPALVSTTYQKALDQFLPSPGAFNHVIVHSKVDGNTVWLDPTLNYQFGSLEVISGNSYQRGLVIKSDETSLRQIKSPQNDKITVNYSYKSDDYEQPVIFIVESKYAGKEAEVMRHIISRNSKEDLAIYYLNFYSRFYPSVTQHKNLKIHDNKLSNIITVMETYAIVNYWDVSDGWYTASVPAYQISQYVKLPRTIKREMPLRVQYPIEIIENVQFDFPNILNWGADKAPVSVSDDVMDFERKIDVQDKIVTINYRYRSKQDGVSVAAVEAHVGRLKKVDDYISYAVSVKPNNNNRKRRLQSVLKDLMNRKKN